MKKIIFIFFATSLVVISTTSCKKIIAAVFGGTDVNTPAIQDTIPVIPFVLPAEVQLGTYTFPFNLDSVVRANTGGVFGAKAVNSVKLKQFTFELLNADTANNIANLMTARIELTSNSDNNPAEILNVTLPDSTASTFIYTPTSTPELLPYIKGSQITYTLYGRVRRVTTKPLLFSVSGVLRAN